MNNTGLFGKLPTYGDFLCRDLESGFVEVWDTWLQGFVGGTQEQLGENWLDTYLTSPIWRFALSEGVVDEHVWAGIVLPSVDRVGRYFPFSIVRKLNAHIRPTELIANRIEWFEELEEIALQALDGEIMIDDIVEEINFAKLDDTTNYQKMDYMGGAMGPVINMDFEGQAPNSVYPLFLDASMRQMHVSYGAWSTRGSQLVEPCVFFTKGLPQISGVASMLDGEWAESNWDEPFQLIQQPEEQTDSEL